MSSSINKFIGDFSQHYARHKYTTNTAYWDVATNATKEANMHLNKSQELLMRFLADTETFKRINEYRQSPSDEPLLNRQLDIMYYITAGQQRDESDVQQIVQLEGEIRSIFTNFRATIDGNQYSDNQLEEILHTTSDSDTAQKTWCASKQIGSQVADLIRQLAKVRNNAARKNGFRDFFEESLQLQEINENELFSFLNYLEENTNDLFNNLKETIDFQRAAHFGISKENLRAYHFGDRFFQKLPPMDTMNMDHIFSTIDIVKTAEITYSSFGMDVDDILTRSDLYEREGKNQHAFCIHIDRGGDIRTLNNLRPNYHWTQTLLHELGHAVYEKYLDYRLPWLLRSPPHMMSTEALANYMMFLLGDKGWLSEILHLPQVQLETVYDTANRIEKFQRLLFTRWVFTVINFEKELYRDPEQDLDGIWWKLAGKFQGIKPPSDWKNPDWASKFHIALAPVYYHNYEFGYCIAAQIEAKVKEQFGNLINNKAAGEWLIQNYIKPSSVYEWKRHIKEATGETLNPGYFIKSLK